jgi:outer membrane protein assembly factor BamB
MSFLKILAGAGAVLLVISLFRRSRSKEEEIAPSPPTVDGAAATERANPRHDGRITAAPQGFEFVRKDPRDIRHSGQGGSGGMSTPLILGGTLYYAGIYETAVYAVDLHSRKRLWKFALPRDRDDAFGPAAISDRALFVTSRSALIAIELHNGVERWQYPERFYNLSAENGTVYATGRHRLVALNAADGKVRWEKSLEVDVPGAPTLNDKLLYIVGDKRIDVFDPGSGAPRFKIPLEKFVNPEIDGRPEISVDAERVFTSIDRKLVVFDAATGAERWHFSEEPVQSFAALDDRNAYFVTSVRARVKEIDDILYSLNAVDKVTGKSVFRSPIGSDSGGIVSDARILGPTISGNAVVLAMPLRAHDAAPFAIAGWDTGSGKKLWEGGAADLTSPPVVMGKSIFWGNQYSAVIEVR